MRRLWVRDPDQVIVTVAVDVLRKNAPRLLSFKLAQTNRKSMKLIWTFLTAYIALIASATTLAQQRLSREAVRKPDPSPTGWKLVWADEFDKDGKPDPRNWSYETGFVRNREFQWYQPDNARCEKGMLIIEGRRERKQNPNYDSNSKDWKAC